ncbi:uncharacterized protein LOC134692257 [Mytilus trossulus]|uniref:uncharacterized protein LOC134692257 n=1 Tax=Mytilus trossulus TaxID=6551 RepID=UPI003003F199
MLSDEHYDSYDNGSYEDTCEQSEIYIPATWVTVTLMCLAVETIVVNLVVIIVFIRPKHRTPSTVLLSLLAASDSIAAILASIPKLAGFVFYTDDLEENIEYFGGWIWFEHYPDCNAWMYVINISSAFHCISISITVILCIQKVIALRFPLWSLQREQNKSNKFLMCLILVLFTSVFAWKTVKDNKMLYNGRNNVCCFNDIYETDDIDLLNTGLNIFLLASVLIIILCTVYLSFKLFKNTKYSHRIRNTTANARAQRSAMLVLLISIVFVLSEILNILTTINYSRLLPTYSVLLEGACDSYCLLSRQVGFSLNLIVYLIMSENLRNTIITTFAEFFVCQRRTKSKQLAPTINSISNGTMSTHM